MIHPGRDPTAAIRGSKQHAAGSEALPDPVHLIHERFEFGIRNTDIVLIEREVSCRHLFMEGAETLDALGLKPLQLRIQIGIDLGVARDMSLGDIEDVTGKEVLNIAALTAPQRDGQNVDTPGDYSIWPNFWSYLQEKLTISR